MVYPTEINTFPVMLTPDKNMIHIAYYILFPPW